MIRRLTLTLVIVVALMVAVVAPAALAQGSPTCLNSFAADESNDNPPAPPLVESDSALRADAIIDSADARIEAALCAEATAYPGPFTNRPSIPIGPFAAGPISVTAAPQPAAQVPVPVATTSRDAADLAHSGSESAILAYIGTGLVAFGAVALGSRRRFVSE